MIQPFKLSVVLRLVGLIVIAVVAMLVDYKEIAYIALGALIPEAARIRRTN